MSSIHSKFISGLDDKVAELLVPAISEGQVITAYVDEPISPYKINGQNFSLPDNIGILFHEFHSISAAEISAKSFALTRQIIVGLPDSIAVSLNGCPLALESDFIVSGNSIAWNSKALQNFGLLEGDIFSISYLTSEA